MLTKYIPRGIIYHDLNFDFLNLFKVLFSRLDNENEVEKFEKIFANNNESDFCVAFPFARMGIFHSLKALDIPKGSEIIMPPISIKAILDVVLEYGLKPKFVDLDLKTYCYNLNDLQSKINENTKAILITYLYGLVPEVDKIIDISKQNNLKILEDFSQCLNGKYKDIKVGNFGDIGIYSSSTTKTLDTYGGGLCVTSSKNIYNKLKQEQKLLKKPKRFNLFKKVFLDFVRNLLTNIYVFNFLTIWIIKLLRLFKPDSMTKYVGERSEEKPKNFPKEYYEKFSSFQAQVGIKTLGNVEKFDSMRINNVNKINESIPSLDSFNSNQNNVYWQYLYLLNEDNLKNPLQFFKNHKVDTSQSSLPLLSNLKKYNFQQSTPNAEKILLSGYFLPSYHKLKKKDIERISMIIEGLVNE